MSVTLDHLLEPIAHWLDDGAVEDVCINELDRAWIYTRGGFTEHPIKLDKNWIEDLAIVAAAQRRQDVGYGKPLLATDLAGRGRLQIVLSPCVAEDRPSIVVRRGSSEWPTLRALGMGGLFKETKAEPIKENDQKLLSLYQAKQWEEFLRAAVRARKTIIVCGVNASGKTHLSKALLGEIPLDERLITIEDAPELRDLPHPNRVSLYYAKDGDGSGVRAPQLVESALRMRIGRLFLQEIRDGEASVALLLALQTGHDGGITTIHAKDCPSVFTRLRVLIKQTYGGAAVNDHDINQQLMELVDIVVHTARDADGGFQVDEVFYSAASELPQ